MSGRLGLALFARPFLTATGALLGAATYSTIYAVTGGSLLLFFLLPVLVATLFDPALWVSRLLPRRVSFLATPVLSLFGAGLGLSLFFVAGHIGYVVAPTLLVFLGNAVSTIHQREAYRARERREKVSQIQSK